jgi:DNA-binding response OmpR family regulator
MSRVLIVCQGSVTRALLASLVTAAGNEAFVVDTLARAAPAVGPKPPDAIILEAAIVRAGGEGLERLRAAWPKQVPIVLADRAYADERRGQDDVRAFGAAAYLAIPPDAGALEIAMRRALGATTGPRKPVPSVIPPDPESAPPLDAEQFARYAERLWSRLDTLDAYQLLRVPSTATDDDIKTAFRARALEFHPDRHGAGTDEAARERIYQIFKRISWAFRKVGEPKARKEYDAARLKTA